MIISLAFHDHTYLMDFTIEHLPLHEGAPKKDAIVDFVIEAIKRYEYDNHVKFVGAAMPRKLVEMSPKLCSRLWLDTDVVPIVIELNTEKAGLWSIKHVDEQADSMARKCGEYLL
jgi:hypothetical protein